MVPSWLFPNSRTGKPQKQLQRRCCDRSHSRSGLFLFILCPLFPDLSDVDGVLKRANDTEYGLASGVFTRDINKAMYVSEQLEAGTVFVNTYNKTDVASPFGGFKQSGFGKDLGENQIFFKLLPKVVLIPVLTHTQQQKRQHNSLACPHRI